MNDSCGCRVDRTGLRANQVFPLEILTTILHGTLALFRGFVPELNGQVLMLQ